ncbi:MAG: acyltransferase [Nanoarchaeota archaeon]
MPQKPILEKFDEGLVSSTSIVNEHVRLGKDSKIWHFCNVYGAEDGEVNIGEDTQVGSFTEIKPNVRVGSHCRFQSHVFVPDYVSIGNYVFVGPGVVFTNDPNPSAIKSMKREELEKLEKTNIGDYAIIGAGSKIFCGITLGKFCLVGLGSVVIRDVPDYGVVAGNPAKVIGDIRDEKYKERFKELQEIYDKVK